MGKIILPKQQKIDETEDIVVPSVKCSFCDKQTLTGLHQTRLEMVEKAVTKMINGKMMYKPPVMKRIDYYMCPKCVASGVKWPGARP